MFHISNYGNFGAGLHRYADAEGYVPEDEDKGMPPPGWDFAAWHAHVDRAIEATQEASAALAEWRAANA